MKTSSTRAGSAIAIVTGLLSAFSGFALMLEEVGPDFDWQNASIGGHVILILIGLVLFCSGSIYPAFFGNSEDDLSRPSSSSDDFNNSDFGDGGD